MFPEGRVVITGWRSGERVYFSSDDCSGQAFGTTDIFIYDMDGQLGVPHPNAQSPRFSRIPISTAVQAILKRTPTAHQGHAKAEQSVVNAYPLVEYTPAERISQRSISG